jgi:hypothetical protein
MELEGITQEDFRWRLRQMRANHSHFSRNVAPKVVFLYSEFDRDNGPPVDLGGECVTCVLDGKVMMGVYVSSAVSGKHLARDALPSGLGEEGVLFNSSASTDNKEEFDTLQRHFEAFQKMAEAQALASFDAPPTMDERGRPTLKKKPSTDTLVDARELLSSISGPSNTRKEYKKHRRNDVKASNAKQMVSDDGTAVTKNQPLRFNAFMKPWLLAPDIEDFPHDELAIEFQDFELPHTKEGMDWFKNYQGITGATLAASDNGWIEVFSSRKLAGMETTLDGCTGVLLRRCKKVEVSSGANKLMEYMSNMRECNEQIGEYVDTKDLQKLIGWHKKIKIIKEALARLQFPLAPDLTLWMVGLGIKAHYIYIYTGANPDIHKFVYQHMQKYADRYPGTYPGKYTGRQLCSKFLPGPE